MFDANYSYAFKVGYHNKRFCNFFKTVYQDQEIDHWIWDHCNFNDITFKNVVFKDVIFLRSFFHDCNFIECKFINCSFQACLFEFGKWDNLTFEYTEISDVLFCNTILTKVSLHTLTIIEDVHQNCGDSMYIKSISLFNEPICYFSKKISGVVTVYVCIGLDLFVLEDLRPNSKFAKTYETLANNLDVIKTLIKTFPTTPVYIEE